MSTRVIDKELISEAVQCLKNGGTVVFPTETVYGLGADAFNPDAVMKIFKAKMRPADNPLIVHIADRNDLNRLTDEVPHNASLLIEAFWPGPLTLILPKKSSVPNVVTAGLNTVAVRMPSNPIAKRLITESNVLIAAPSANLSGSPSPTVCEDVIDDLFGRVDYIIDGTGCEIGLESTVVDVSENNAVILRPGAITLEMIKELIPDAKLDSGLIDNDSVPKCPGLKYTHYSPKAEVIVVQGDEERVHEYITSAIKNDDESGVISYGKNHEYPGAKLICNAGSDMNEYAHNLFSMLREFDKKGIKTVYAQFRIEDGIGVAVRNRLYKAAGHKVIEV